MELTSGALLGLLVVVALGLSAATIWFWPRFAGRGVRPLLARIGLFGAAQLAIVVTLLAGANSYYLFYASWSDLLGTSHRPVRVETDGASAGHPVRARSAPASRPVVTLTKGYGQNKRTDWAREGRVDQIAFPPAARSGLSTKAFVYLPPQYFQKAPAKRRFPVMYDFSGYPGDARQLITRLHVPTTAAKEMNAGRVQPMIIVMMRPSPDSVMPRDTECTDVPGGPQVLTFFTQDVPEALASAYQVSSSPRGWGAMGDSTGGYCAVKLAMFRSDRFSAAVAMAGYFYPRQDITTEDLYGGSRQVKQDNSLIWRLQHLPPPPISVLVTSSEQGERDYGEARRFLSLARPPMTTDKVLVDQGGHNPRTWRRVLPSALQWMGAHLQP